MDSYEFPPGDPSSGLLKGFKMFAQSTHNVGGGGGSETIEDK